MGDRGNIVILRNSRPDLYFYTHWSGSDLPNIVANGLKRGEDRWGDDPYLNRVLFCELVKDDVLEETGYGIDTVMGDGGTEVYVDHENQTVEFEDETYDFGSFVDKYGEDDA